MLVPRAPRTNAEWARDVNARLRALEQPATSRIGNWVLSSRGGHLVARSGDGAEVVIAPPEAQIAEVIEQTRVVGAGGGDGVELSPDLAERIVAVVSDWIVRLVAQYAGVDLVAARDAVSALVAAVKSGNMNAVITAMRDLAGEIIVAIRSVFGVDLSGLFKAVETIHGIADAIVGIPGAALAQVQRVFANLRSFLGVDLNAARLTTRINDVINQIVTFFNNLSPLNWNPIKTIRQAWIPARHLVEEAPELLDNPDFIGAVSISSQEEWVWDESVTEGSARIVCDGRRHTLLSNPIQVIDGQVVPFTIKARWADLVATGSAIRVSIWTYDLFASRTGVHYVTGITNPSGTSNVGQLSGSYTAVGDDAWIALCVDVMPTATSGTVWITNGSTKTAGHTTPQMPPWMVQGLQGMIDLDESWQSQLNQWWAALNPPDHLHEERDATVGDVGASMNDLVRQVADMLQWNRRISGELGLSVGEFITPVTIQPDAQFSGSYDVVLPAEWDRLDCVVDGGGGGGGSSSGIFAGQGGDCGKFEAVRLWRDTVPVGESGVAARPDTVLHGFVGGGGQGGSPGAGGNGGSSWLTYVTAAGEERTITGAGGLGGGIGGLWSGLNPVNSNQGRGPGTFTFHGTPFFGGSNVAASRVGSGPGGGGGGGALIQILGAAGAAGTIWVIAYPPPPGGGSNR